MARWTRRRYEQYKRKAADADRSAVRPSAVERPAKIRPMEAKEDTRCYSSVDIVITSYRKRKHDTDGVSAKAAIDGLVRCGILKDDSLNEVKEVTFISHLCKKGEEAKTIIEIYEAMEDECKKN